MPTRRILLLGDVCAAPGRAAVQQQLPELRRETGADFVIANGENAAAGYGITPKLADGLLRAGVDCLTTGDHAFDRREGWPLFDSEPRVLRPLNYPPGAPGQGSGVYEASGFRVAVVNLQGRVFMKALDCPFRRVMPVVQELARQTRVIIVDFHAEATAEKQSMGWFLDGHVAAVIGTHTHVQTADERVLPGGTAYVSDAGMCGAFDSVLGVKKGLSLRRLIEMVPVRLETATGDVRLNGVLVEIDQETGRAAGIRRISEPVTLPEPPPVPEPGPGAGEPSASAEA
ncbi:TIGR00282 family metallophosphoesterase [candidate division WOR-3 bacterium]|nr:TIGR00282 family metallophosphoesterase [candidate division WOR-3 bacterium]